MRSLGLRDLRFVQPRMSGTMERSLSVDTNTSEGRAWAIFDALPDTSTDTYEHLKEALLSELSPDTEENRQSAHESLSRRKLRENQESIDELARDLERLLDKASPGLPAINRNAELRYHLLNALPEKVALQLKLLPKVAKAYYYSSEWTHPPLLLVRFSPGAVKIV